MNLFFKEKDNILSIIKTLSPIKYLYSRQNKAYDKYFRGANLKDFVKQINSQKTINKYLAPDERLEEFDDKNTDIKPTHKNSFNYFEELSNLKKISFSVFLKKNKTSKNNSENKKDNKNKIIEKTKEIKIIKLNKKKKKKDIIITIEPGRYNPNYDYIRRRNPCAYLGKPKDAEEFYNKTVREKGRKDKKILKNIIKEYNFEYNKNIQNSRNANSKNEKNKKKLLYTFYPHRLVDDRPNTVLKLKKINLKHYRNIRKINKKENNYVTLDSPTKVKTAKSSIKLLNTVSSWTKTNYMDNMKRDKNKSIGNSIIHFYNTQRPFRIHKKNLTKKTSYENLRCPIIFNKMPGRDRPVNFIKETKDENKIPYNPNYNYIKPHVPSTIFRAQRQHQDIKKYMTYKIIRSYCYNTEEYFVFNFNNNKEHEMKTKTKSRNLMAHVW